MSTTSKPVLWVGRVLSALPVLMLTFSAVMKFSRSPQVMEGFVGKFGYPEGTLLPIGVVELICALLYAVPRTSVLGAILLTGYMGGATATHVRVSDPWFMAVLLGVVAWAGLYLREPRLRALLPLRTKAD
jgi:uncharacterized membrane protein YphA (DoxX/SURF4 family)